MNKIAKFFMAIAMVSILLSTSGCFGKFSLVRTVYKWNDSVAGNDKGGKFFKTLLMYVMMIIPVYEISGFVDMVIFNLIEFWSGSNPLTMNVGQKETQIVEKFGETYEITATRNKFEIKQLTGTMKGNVQSLTFNPDELAWINTNKGVSTKVIQYKVENGELVSVTYFGAKGQSREVDKAQLDNMLATYAMK